MLKKTILAMGLAAGALLAPLSGPVDASTADATYEAADAGSLGAAPETDDGGWCHADAGSLGHPDPRSACG